MPVVNPPDVTGIPGGGFSFAGINASSTTATTTVAEPAPQSAVDWANAILLQLGIDPVTHPLSVLDLVGQMQLEHGSQDIGYNNPLFSTQQMPGSTSINSVGVQSYASWQDGVAANATLIQNNSADAAMLTALQNNANGTDYGAALAQSAWEGFNPGAQAANTEYGNSVASVINGLPHSVLTSESQAWSDFLTAPPANRTGLIGQVGQAFTQAVPGAAGAAAKAAVSPIASFLGLANVNWVAVGGIALAVLIGLIGLYIMFHNQIDKGVSTVVQTAGKAGEVAAA